jgi:hypothetical protein
VKLQAFKLQACGWWEVCARKRESERKGRGGQGILSYSSLSSTSNLQSRGRREDEKEMDGTGNYVYIHPKPPSTQPSYSDPTTGNPQNAIHAICAEHREKMGKTHESGAIIVQAEGSELQPTPASLPREQRQPPL